MNFDDASKASLYPPNLKDGIILLLVRPSSHQLVVLSHPFAVILAVSTSTPNPLQAIDALHSRNIQLPQWVDTNFLRFNLIIHPQGSSLSDEEFVCILAIF